MNNFVCADCGHEQDSMEKPCGRCYRNRVVMISVVEETFGCNWRTAFWTVSQDVKHSVGNPVFAIETNLHPLIKRIEENKVEEAVQIIQDIHVSVEKIKDCLARLSDETESDKLFAVYCKKVWALRAYDANPNSDTLAAYMASIDEYKKTEASLKV